MSLPATPPALPLPLFPSQEEWARSLFEEGARHLKDAWTLHTAARHAASIASAAKAAELGVKAVLVLDGAMGWFDALLTSHAPLTNIKGHRALRRHYEQLHRYDQNLARQVEELEQLAPGKPGAGSFEEGREQNPEYPFVAVSVDSTGTRLSRLHRPELYFDAGRSQECYGVARHFLMALQDLYPEVAAWSVALPPII